MLYLVIRNDPLMDEPSSSRPSQPVSGDDPNMEVTASGEMFEISMARIERCRTNSS